MATNVCPEHESARDLLVRPNVDSGGDMDFKERLRLSIEFQKALRSRPATSTTFLQPETISSGSADLHQHSGHPLLMTNINDDMSDGDMYIDSDKECTVDHIGMNSYPVDIGRKRIQPPNIEETTSVPNFKRAKRSYSDLRRQSLQYESCEAALHHACSCGNMRNGVHCLSKFKSPGEILDARLQHYDRTPKEEYRLRLHDINEALKFKRAEEKSYIIVTLKSGQNYKVCFSSYAALLQIPPKSFWRTVGQVKNYNKPPASIGRPQGHDKDSDPIGSLKTEECLEWIRKWAEMICDESPTGDDWAISIDPVDVKEVHEEYDGWFRASHFFAHEKPTSFTSFNRVWKHWLKVDRVKIRNKSNTTTKCMKCEDLRSRARAIGVTAKDLENIKMERKKHRDEIRALREFYHRDVQRANSDPTFASIIFDGTDSSYCICPQSWRGMVRMEQATDTFVEQKIQSVLIHGVGLYFYVVVPFVSKGMDLTVSVLLDALTVIPPEVQYIRFQFDGIQ